MCLRHAGNLQRRCVPPLWMTPLWMTFSKLLRLRLPWHRVPLDCPQGVKDLWRACTEKNPQRRPTAQEAKRMLTRLLKASRPEVLLSGPKAANMPPDGFCWKKSQVRLMQFLHGKLCPGVWPILMCYQDWQSVTLQCCATCRIPSLSHGFCSCPYVHRACEPDIYSPCRRHRHQQMQVRVPAWTLQSSRPQVNIQCVAFIIRNSLSTPAYYA